MKMCYIINPKFLIILFSIYYCNSIYSQTLFGTIDAGCSNGTPPGNIIDNNTSTFFEKSNNPCPLYLNIHFTRTIYCANVKIYAAHSGIIINPTSSNNYYRTVNNTDEFVIVLPNGFSNIELTYPDNSQGKVYEVQVTEISLDNVYVPFTYENAGNMIFRKIVLNITKSANDDSPDSKEFHEKVGKRDITIFPNPTEGQLHIKLSYFNSEDNASYKIFSETGALIYEDTFRSDIINIDLSNYPSGCYIMKFILNSETQQWVIIKE